MPVNLKNDGQENTLESVLRLAVNNAAHSAEFNRVLLKSTVYVLGTVDQALQGAVTLTADTKALIKKYQRADGSLAIPFFSSLGALQKVARPGEQYIAMPARTLFEITRGASLSLNPQSGYTKDFYPADIQSVLSAETSTTCH